LQNRKNLGKSVRLFVMGKNKKARKQEELLLKQTKNNAKNTSAVITQVASHRIFLTV